jgi:hypothetical protein
MACWGGDSLYTVDTQINNGTIVGVSALEQKVVVNFVG